ncbi:hypothetical protein ACFORH_14135 [Amycolatopsis roodepoortensis]|uniref:Lipoprotein n=1 Tax=Amycolatopsis roodepoortensis TaxID=700274 RepID=A0ABR9KYP1_9PSEU|nr:hypothetical protein [Amycolatopsis roodepoortensis]MBE1573485.1 hypothetical protein [Amycolatopsis roodepoortensis]
MRRLATTLLISAGILAGCSAPAPTATAGAEALGTRLTTMDDLVDWIDETAGDCAAVSRREIGELRTFVGPDIAARFQPHVAEWATCRVSPEFPVVGLILFDGDEQRRFQESWHAAMRAGEIADGPTFAFGNGFAVSAGFLGVGKLGLYYFRCGNVDPRVHQVPSGVAGCVFANPEHGHGHH